MYFAAHFIQLRWSCGCELLFTPHFVLGLGEDRDLKAHHEVVPQVNAPLLPPRSSSGAKPLLAAANISVEFSIPICLS